MSKEGTNLFRELHISLRETYTMTDSYVNLNESCVNSGNAEVVIVRDEHESVTLRVELCTVRVSSVST